MREKIVGLLAGQRPHFRDRRAGLHLPRRRRGAARPDGRDACQLIDDPQTAAWTPVGHRRDRQHPAGPARPARAPRAARRVRRRARASRAPRVEPSSPLIGRLRDADARRTSRDPTCIVVEEAPSARPVMQRYLPISDSEGFYTMDSGGLGCGMPAAVGVALGKPGRRIVAMIGDGSSIYSIQALWSAAQLGPADHVRHPQQQALRRPAGFRAGVRLQPPTNPCRGPICRASTSRRSPKVLVARQRAPTTPKRFAKR